jgi:hypothetical protein
MMGVFASAWRRLMFWRRERTAPVAAPEPLQLVDPPKPVVVVVESEEERAARRERRREQLHLSKLRNKIAAKANDILDRFEKLDFRRVPTADRVGKRDYEIAVNGFQGRDLLCLDLVEDLPGGSEWVALDPAGEERDFLDAVWPLDFGCVTYKEDKDLPYYFLHHVEPADVRELRGKIKIVPTRIVHSRTMFLYDDGSWRADWAPLGLVGGTWQYLDEGITRQRGAGIHCYESGRSASSVARREIHESMSILTSMALTERYSWHVSLGLPAGPRLLLPTNPGGCLALFKDREKGVAEQRRRALRHWVRNHFRNTDAENLAYVRDHLRGATDFNWYGLGCRLMVSQFDLEKNEEFRLEAEQWRANRKHNRVKIRLKR